MRKYCIDCFNKKTEEFASSIELHIINQRQCRRILNLWNKKLILDQIEINKKLKLKFETRFKIKINTRKYDCFFSEIVK